MIEYLSLILAIPLGIILAGITKDEKQIYSKKPYFPILIPALAIAAAISCAINQQIALTLTFIFIITLTWNYS
jgi:hypothetical protein